MHSTDIFLALIEHNLELRPVVDEKGVRWTCGRVELTGNGYNAVNYYVTGHPTPWEAARAWLDLYGPEPKHKITAGVEVTIEPLPFRFRVASVTRWDARVETVGREAMDVPLHRVRRVA